MRCCGPLQEIELRPAADGAPSLAMLRCTTCSRRDWQLGGVAVPQEQAFGVLSDSYRSAPRLARAQRERAASRSTARAAVRAASVAAAAEHEQPATSDRADLAALLRGWTVLGAA